MVSTCCCFVQRWHYIQLAISRPTSVTLFMLFIRLMPKSLRWLISRGRSRRAKAVAERMVSCSGPRLSPELLLQLEKLCHTVGAHLARDVVVKDLFRTTTVRRNLVVLFSVWLSFLLTYYGISQNIDDLSGNRFFNFMLGWALELAAFLPTYLSP